MANKRTATATYPTLLRPSRFESKEKKADPEVSGDCQFAPQSHPEVQLQHSASSSTTPSAIALEPVEVQDFELSKEDALRLQNEFMAAFNTPAFQKQLFELGRSHGPGTGPFQSALGKLVRAKQLEIIPGFGFQSSEAGLMNMLQAFKSLETDPDIQVNNVAMKDLLSLEQPEISVPEARMVVDRPSTKHRILDVLRVQLIEFSKATFQHEVEELKCQASHVDAAQGFFHLPGRAELALLVQQVLLPQYGFAASREGVQDMMRHCAPFARDPDVATLLDRLNGRLGMSPAACERFRDLLLNVQRAQLSLDRSASNFTL